ncbi:MAG: DsbA family oxidoreductase [Limimaricola soesokkakensis]|uniref:DsbA family oxidoreductase n=1 Tax=Limimaricola soesokkakensis TaxID=1343159 RepID=UPI0040594EB7
MSEPIRIDIVSDVVCPWCVIGYSQLARAAKETGIAIEIHWHPFELNPKMAEEGENLREHLAAKYGTSPEASAQARARLTELGGALGFTFDYADDMRMVNTFRAHRLIDWATEQGRGHETNLALFEAFFTRRENLNDPEVLVALAAGLGFDRDVARVAIEDEARSELVRRKQGFWTAQGISGVPAMVFERQHLVTGAQGEETYARILQHLVEARAA